MDCHWPGGCLIRGLGTATQEQETPAGCEWVRGQVVLIERMSMVCSCRDEITLVFQELNGNPGGTIQLRLILQQLMPLTLLEYICGLDSLPDSWNRKYLRESDLALSIGDAAISDEMSLHQNGQCCLPDGCVPLSECACVQVSQTAP